MITRWLVPSRYLPPQEFANRSFPMPPRSVIITVIVSSSNGTGNLSETAEAAKTRARHTRTRLVGRPVIRLFAGPRIERRVMHRELRTRRKSFSIRRQRCLSSLSLALSLCHSRFLSPTHRFSHRRHLCLIPRCIFCGETEIEIGREREGGGGSASYVTVLF